MLLSNYDNFALEAYDDSCYHAPPGIIPFPTLNITALSLSACVHLPPFSSGNQISGSTCRGQDSHHFNPALCE